MATQLQKKSQSRMFIAIALFVASIATSFFIAFLSNQGSSYWVVKEPVPIGAKIASADIGLVKIKLARATAGYLSSAISPVGAISKRALIQGEILHRSALTESARELTAESISLAIRSSDIPPSVKLGDQVSIYHLHDVRNGENQIEPRLVISSVFVKEISGREGNFSGDLSITVSLNRDDIPTVLAATTSGRLVIVAIGG